MIVVPDDDDWVPSGEAPERRLDCDACPYTKEEFLDWYGGTEEWECALPWLDDDDSQFYEGGYGSRETVEDKALAWMGRFEGAFGPQRFEATQARLLGWMREYGPGISLADARWVVLGE